MKKIITLILLLTITIGIAKTNKSEINKIIKEQSDGIPGQSGDNPSVYQDGKNAVKTVYSDLKSVTPKIESAITNVAKGLKVGAENVWIILVNQQKVWSWCFLILTIASIINWILFYKRNFKNLKEDEYIVGKKNLKIILENPKYSKYSSGDEGKMQLSHDNGSEDIILPINNKLPGFKYVHLIICIILSVFSFYHFADMLTGFMNPEFGALKTIIEVTTKLK